MTSSPQSSAITGRGPDAPAASPGSRTFRSDGYPDRAMRQVLGVAGVDMRSDDSAHHAFRISVVISAVRCTITYVAVPVLLPILSLSGWVASPIGLALCAIAAINGVISLRRFWRIDHPQRWTYTAFIAVVFIILTISTITELNRMGVIR